MVRMASIEVVTDRLGVEVGMLGIMVAKDSILTK